jgi:hypothetical protein
VTACHSLSAVVEAFDVVDTELRKEKTATNRCFVKPIKSEEE